MKKKLKLLLNNSHDSIYVDFADFRCVFKEHGITCVYLIGKEEPIQCRDSVDEISPLPSSGRANASTTRPKKPSPTGT